MIEETQQEDGQSQRKAGNGRSRPGNGSKGGFWGWLLSLFGLARKSGEDAAPTFVDEEGQAQSLEEDETQMVRSILELDKTLAREIMVPRIDIVALDATSSVTELVRTVIDAGVSRIPIYENTIDNVIGVVYAKDVLRYWGQAEDRLSLTQIARSPHFIPETKRVDELLQEFRKKRVHVAIVVDEYGGVAGLVSLEDLMEEIVGEIEDEFDIGAPQIETISPVEVIMDAAVSIDDLNEALSLDIQGEDFDTVGGFIFDRLGKIPIPGDEIREDGFLVSVLTTTGRRIRKVKITKASDPNNGAEAASSSS